MDKNESCLHNSWVLVTESSTEVIFEVAHRPWRDLVEMVHCHYSFLTDQLPVCVWVCVCVCVGVCVCLHEYVCPKLTWYNNYMHGSAHNGQKRSALATSHHHSIDFTTSLCIKYCRNTMIVLLLMLSGHHFYHHSCKSRQNLVHVCTCTF